MKPVGIRWSLQVILTASIRTKDINCRFRKHHGITVEQTDHYLSAICDAVKSSALLTVSARDYEA